MVTGYLKTSCQSYYVKYTDMSPLILILFHLILNILQTQLLFINTLA